MIFRIKKEDWYLLIIFSMIAIAIFVKSYFNPDGFLTIDSTGYLALSQNLLDGNGFFVSFYGLTGNDREFFAIWPIGYSSLIYLTAKLTGLSVFWASKVLNIFLIGLILSVFRVLFKHNAYVYGFIFLFASSIEIFTYTWSETVFIFGLVWFGISIYMFMLEPKKLVLIYISLFVSSLFLFLSRYIGAFSFGLIGLLGLYYGFVKKDKSKSIILITIASFNIVIMFGYLYHNYLQTGFPTGMPRIAAPETDGELFVMLLRAIISETIIPMNSISKTAMLIFWMQFSVLIYLIVKYRTSIFNVLKNSQNNKTRKLVLVFISIGLVYLFFIILMRWLVQFDTYRARLLAPGSFLLFIAFIVYIEKFTTEKLFNEFKIFLLSFALLSYFINFPYSVWKQDKQAMYNETIQNIEKKYADVDKNSIVVFGNIHLKYLYTDIQIGKPFYLPYYTNKESWSNFINRINPKHKKDVYLVTSEYNKVKPKYYDQTIVNLVEKYKHYPIVKLP
ncbi:hypothetical protein [Candidatus Marithrix sp. Canyon 246]|uniref:hypothetical protein n=1 Tax=Candidatus Marithrix sp. Canyon 246 TaxID=1827136 RepID=UPI00084A2D00|nr:hypothetical protein [Candidatus Marithrix sp. Canyon 246]